MILVFLHEQTLLSWYIVRVRDQNTRATVHMTWVNWTDWWKRSDCMNKMNETIIPHDVLDHSDARSDLVLS